jgi:hypothetical protein
MYMKRLTENLVQKALVLFEILGFEVYCRSVTPQLADMGVGDSPTHWYGESATPQLPMQGVGESTKGKIKALDLYVCLLLQAPLVQLKHACAKKTVHFKYFIAVGYSAKNL